MNFKRIEIVGFKSFADRTIIPFSEGMTAIVGPNGCGKSNVVDAIRWCLGEQSSKTMRSSSMQEVIFNGTEKRKSLSYCEVTMVLDNSNKMFNIEYDEIAITRKLYRSGESEYLINKNPCRLKDITNLLYDSGLGKDGYSIISQGQVAEILNSKPEQRRAIFEEAAGIAKFKGEKKSNEAKLERTRNNISQIQIKLSEIERQLGPLLEQAEVAKRYLNFKENLKVLEVNNYIYQYENATDIKQKIKTKIDGYKDEATTKQAVLDDVLKQYNDNFDEINGIDKKIAVLYNQIMELSVNLERKSGETNIIRERLNALYNDKQRLSNEFDEKQQNLNNLKSELKFKNEKRTSNMHQINAYKEESQKISASYFAIVDELTKSEDEVGQTQLQMFSALDKLSEIKAEISKYQTEKTLLNEDCEQLQKQIEILTIKYQECTKNYSELKSANEQYERQKSSLNDKQKQLLASFNETIFLKRQNEQEFVTKSASKTTIDSRLKFLNDLQRDLDGYNYAVKSILQNSQKISGLKDKFIGVVANLVKVPSIYQSAIDTALGNAIQNIVTSNENNAEYLVNYLKENNFGRATFLPLTSIKPRRIDDKWESKLNQKGVYGVATQLIEYDKNLSNVFDSLLGGTVVTDNINTAINLAKDCEYSFKIVTLDGDVVNPQGSISGGSKKNNASNILGREKEIEETQKIQQQVNNEYTELLNEKNRLELKYSNLESEIKTVNEQIKQLDIDNAKQSEQLGVAYKMVNDLQQNITENKTQYNDLQEKLTEINDKLAINNQLLMSLNDNKSDANESISKRQMQFDSLKKEREHFNEKNTELKVKIAELNSENIAFDNDLIRLENEINACAEYLEKLNETVTQNSNAIIGAQNAIQQKSQQADIKEITEEREVIKQKLASLDSYKAGLQENMKTLDEQRMTLSTAISKLQDKRYGEEMNLTKVDSDMENMQERVWEEYKLTYSSALEFKKEQYNLNKGISEANKIKREIENLGFVNVNAIEESKATQERYDAETAEINDLREGEANLSKIIKDLTVEMVKRFNLEFEKIKINFTKVFKELFGGGNAELLLVESESGDILEAGVDIKAVPPGKKISNISQLSGGERALTAIAILFAILRLRPMPFCLLDEMEAALDEANVVRFAKYLKRFTDETQFIVITHRKPTMELADNMFGVTMEEKGVSKVVSVKLSDALVHAEIKEDKDITI